MIELRRCVLVVATALAALSLWGGSAKRGICWEEDAVTLGSHHAELLSPGVSWVYNWGPDAANSEVYGDGFCFLPMAWNASYSPDRIRTWLSNHPETRYLLGFNEPNFASQAAMTPAQAAQAWPALEAIADEFGLRLVAPALNFTDSQVGGRFWNPYEWYDEFFRLLPEAKIDCIAMHCYMNWYSANTWLATEYFYADLFNPRKDCYGRYPNLVAFLENFRTRNGHFPKMMLTEFCSWENDGTIKNVDFQIDQMTQKVQFLEQSDLVEGYAWFMANAKEGASAYPYMSLFERNSADSDLSELGKVYVNMSAFDRSRYYLPGETVEAKDYVNATTDDRQIRVRSNDDAASPCPLRIELPAGAYCEYLVDVPADATYRFTFRLRASDAGSLALYVDSKKSAASPLTAENGQWHDVDVETTLTAGRHSIMPYNAGSAPFFLNSLTFTASDGVAPIVTPADSAQVQLFTLKGIAVDNSEFASLPAGIYVVRESDGTSKLIKI